MEAGGLNDQNPCRVRIGSELHCREGTQNGLQQLGKWCSCGEPLHFRLYFIYFMEGSHVPGYLKMSSWVNLLRSQNSCPSIPYARACLYVTLEPTWVLCSLGTWSL